MKRVLVVGDIGQPVYHVGDEAMTMATAAALAGAGSTRDSGLQVVLATRDAQLSEEHIAAAAQSSYEYLPFLQFPWAPAEREITLERLEEFLVGGVMPQLPDFAPDEQQIRDFVAGVQAMDAVVISGGGNLNSRYGWLLYERAAIALAAQYASIPVFISGQSFGPVFSLRDEEVLLRMLRSAAAVSARELTSWQWCRSHNFEALLGVDDAIDYSYAADLPAGDASAAEIRLRYADAPEQVEGTDQVENAGQAEETSQAGAVQDGAVRENAAQESSAQENSAQEDIDRAGTAADAQEVSGQQAQAHGTVPSGVTPAALAADLPERYVCVTINEISEQKARELAVLLDKIYNEYGLASVFLPHMGDPLVRSGRTGDYEVHQRIASAMKSPATLLPILHADAAVRIHREAALNLSSRYHPAVFSLSAGVPVVALVPNAFTETRLSGALGHYGLQNFMTPLHMLGTEIPEKLVEAALNLPEQAHLQIRARHREMLAHLHAWRTYLLTRLHGNSSVRPPQNMTTVGALPTLDAALEAINTAVRELFLETSRAEGSEWALSDRMHSWEAHLRGEFERTRDELHALKRSRMVRAAHRTSRQVQAMRHIGRRFR